MRELEINRRFEVLGTLKKYGLRNDYLNRYMVNELSSTRNVDLIHDIQGLSNAVECVKDSVFGVVEKQFTLCVLDSSTWNSCIKITFTTRIKCSQ